MTATVFLFMDSSMASCVSWAVSSISWNCVSPSCTAAARHHRDQESLNVEQL